MYMGISRSHNNKGDSMIRVLFNIYHTARAVLLNTLVAPFCLLFIVCLILACLLEWAEDEFSWRRFNIIKTYKTVSDNDWENYNKITGRRK